MNLDRITSRALVLLAAAIALGSSPSLFAQGRAVALFKGQATEADGTPATGVAVSVYKDHEKVINSKTTDEGRFQGILPSAGTYRVTFKSDKYFYREDTLVIDELTSYKEIQTTTQLRPIRNGASYPVEAQIFRPGKSSIEPGARTELDALIAALRQNPQLGVRMSTFPDTDKPSKKRGPSPYKLAEDRSNALQSYFFAQGIRNISVRAENSVPSEGRFEEKTGKGKRAKTILVPQYAEIRLTTK